MRSRHGSDRRDASIVTVWVRDGEIVLREATADDVADERIDFALHDQVERGYEGALPAARDGLERYAIEVGGALVGLLGLRRDEPHDGAMVVDDLAIAVAERGHAYGTRALLAAERRLARDGILEGFARVPRGNGRGLYFMLRCGYAPIAALEDEGSGNDGVTWFQRNPALEPKPTSAASTSSATARSAAARPRGTRSRPART
jgi:hypothetical protein